MQQSQENDYMILGRIEGEKEAALAIDILAGDIAKWAQGKGFWNQPAALTELAATNEEVGAFLETMRKSQKGYLMMSELGEHCEALRAPPGTSTDTEGVTDDCLEIADMVIRALDYCGYYKLPIGKAIMLKMAKNQKRPYLHGGKGF